MRATFDEAPELYDRLRPVCPARLFDDLIDLARFPKGARLVEIGSGTGQATLPLAELGFGIVAIELGERLAALARKKLGRFPEVEIVNTSFEAWDPHGRRFDGVVVFHAFHWIDPELRFAKSAQLLRDDGALAVVTSSYVLTDNADPCWRDLQEDYAALGPRIDQAAPPHPDTVGDLGAEIE
ncbi:MAG: class I SAM-dependent methyltransferase, partial [Chloroflexota bacterium]